jgi:hypothetical protein
LLDHVQRRQTIRCVGQAQEVAALEQLEPLLPHRLTDRLSSAEALEKTTRESSGKAFWNANFGADHAGGTTPGKCLVEVQKVIRREIGRMAPIDEDERMNVSLIYIQICQVADVQLFLLPNP